MRAAAAPLSARRRDLDAMDDLGERPSNLRSTCERGFRINEHRKTVRRLHARVEQLSRELHAAEMAHLAAVDLLEAWAVERDSLHERTDY